jgi:hypothetical protein
VKEIARSLRRVISRYFFQFPLFSDRLGLQPKQKVFFLHIIDYFLSYLYLMSCNLDDMTVKCVFHLTVHATMVCCDAVGHFVMHELAAVVVVEAPVRFCGFVDVQFVGVVAGLVIAKSVADLEFQYLWEINT